MSAEKDSTETTVQLDESSADITHLTGLPLATLVTGLCLIVLLITLDISIVATAVPKITDDFDSLADIGWYASAYLLTQCTFVPLAGRTYSYFPFKTTYTSFIALFEIGSVVCGAAQSSVMLIVGRAVAGIGASGIMNGTMTITAFVTPPGQKAVVMGLLVSLFSLGQVLGPLISGALTEHASWRWCFYINLPVAALAVPCFVFVKLPAYPRKPWSTKSLFWDLDIPGFAILAPACVMLLLAVIWGGNEYAWDSATVIGMLCGSGVIFSIFALWELRIKDQAMIPISMIRLRPVALSITIGFLQGGAMLVMTYYLPIYFQSVQDVSPSDSGVRLLPLFLSQVVVAGAAGVMVSKLGLASPPMVFGHALITGCYGLLSTLQPDSSRGEWIGYQVIGGVGRGMALQMPMLVVQSVVPKVEIATSTSTVIWAQFMGMAIMVSAAQAIFVNLLKSTMETLVPQLDADDAIRAGATAYIASVPAELRRYVVQSYNDAVAGTNYLGLGLAAASMILSVGIWSQKVETKLGSKPTSSDTER